MFTQGAISREQGWTRFSTWNFSPLISRIFPENERLIPNILPKFVGEVCTYPIPGI